ncbi:MAG TPA: ABC transporter permease [Sediminibacterium sp.]
MLKNHLIVAWRNLLRNKSFSVINLAGLTIGMAATMLILLWVYTEKSWDKQYKKYHSTYHVMSNRNFNGEINTGPDMMFPLARTAKASLPEVENAAVVSFPNRIIFTVGDKILTKNTLNTTTDFFNIFSFDFVEGDASAIQDPDALIFTESTAKAFFGNTPAVGKTVKVNNDRNAIVKAVVKDIPASSTIQFEALIPFNPSSKSVQAAEQEWVNCGDRVFITTRAGTNIASLEQKMLQLIKTNTKGENPTTKGSLILHPMEKWRLYEEFKDGKNTGGRIQYVSLFIWIALIILAIACVNFMNLSTARSEKRAKEVGIRKTLGSGRAQLLIQFITESLLLSITAAILAMGLVYVLLPLFSQLLNQPIRIPYQEPALWLILTGITVITGLLAGSYPAFYLSGFQPVKVLKGSFLPARGVLLPRKILVTAQFIVSIVLVSATMIIYQQLQFVKKRDLGYSPNNLLTINGSPATDKSFEAIRNDLMQTGMVAAVNRTSSPPTNIFGFTSGVKAVNAPASNNLIIGFMFTDVDLTKTLNARIVAGRDFRLGDSLGVIFNKEAIKLMGLTNPIGAPVTWAGRNMEIVGVVDNMVMGSPYESAAPLMFKYENKWSRYLNVRLTEKADPRKAVSSIENIYKKYSPAFPFEFRFVDDAFNEKFNTEQLISRLSVIFAGLGIFICCLGLFGLVSSSIERRKKEIGIRKVLGANLQQLLLLLSKEFLYLVAIAFLIAIPVAWWTMHRWLENFSYRTSISLLVFILVGLGMLLIALVTVSMNATKAALTNPVKTLRSE